MIYSDRQLTISRAELAKLKAALDTAQENRETGKDWVRQIIVDGLSNQIAEIEADISEYERSRPSKLDKATLLELYEYLDALFDTREQEDTSNFSYMDGLQEIRIYLMSLLEGRDVT